MSETSSTDESLKCQLAERRERDRARRQAKRTAEVWAMPADEVPTEEKGKYNTFFVGEEGQTPLGEEGQTPLNMTD